MTTPSSQSLPQMLLLPAILLVIFAAVAEQQQHPVPRPGCRDKCGDITIPFPFGIGNGCFRDGFEVICNDSFIPPRAFLADNRTINLERSFYDDRGYYQSSPPLELLSISVATSKVRAYAAVSYRCSLNMTGRTVSKGGEGKTFFMSQHINFGNSAFAVSAARNVLIGVGQIVEPVLVYGNGGSVPNLYCRTISERRYMQRYNPVKNGSCEGRGCCETTLLHPGKSLTVSVTEEDDEWWELYPCSYAMLVEKSWYSFFTPDMSGNKTLHQRFLRGVPLVLDFAAGNVSCPAEGQPPPPDYACISQNSSCAEATVTPGYVCRCSGNYTGNPHIAHGCQDIDECKLPENPCSNGGICKNRPGGYDCPCKFGMKADGQGGTCTHVFPPAAMATVGGIGGILLMAIITFLIILHKEKKKTK
ncbi:unnamed protein product [Triticum turgidum subsp. durum]|uniref:EGF-like domain-containing protein n=1 Tax=Triticum turgidum subsp. durum TaxID=4567 RepID=A0A9R1Q1D4_TRITD|nr:unnamed protein product [Triticum turgidum subsp. durum]